MPQFNTKQKFFLLFVCVLLVLLFLQFFIAKNFYKNDSEEIKQVVHKVKEEKKVKPPTFLYDETPISEDIFPNFNIPSFQYDTNHQNYLDTTIVSTASLDRLSRVNFVVERWKHNPISVAIFIQTEESKAFKTLRELYDYYKSKYPLVFERVHLHLFIGKYFWINTLRNLAWSSAKTEYVFLLDIDFIPKEGIESEIKRLGLPKWKEMYVVAARHFECNESFEKNLTLDHCKVGEYLSGVQGQFQTAIRKKEIEESNDLIGPFKYTFGYEPYGIIKSVGVPRYDTRFDFGSNDKVSHIFELAAMDFNFFIYPKLYVAHVPHVGIKNNLHRTRSYERAVALWDVFCKELSEKYQKKIINHYKGS